MEATGSGVQPVKVPERVVGGKPTLYCFETCPFCWKIRSLLSYKKIDFSKVEVDPMSKRELKWSDWTAVPVYVSPDGTQVNDSNDILHYLNKTEGGGEWFPNVGVSAEQDKWMDFSNEILGKSIVAVIYSSYSESRRALSYVAEVDKFTRWQAWKAKWLGGIIMRLVGKSRAKLFELPPKQNLQHQLDKLAAGIDGEYIGGEQPNGGDFANYGILRSIQDMRGFSIVQEHQQISQWYRRMQTASGV